MRFDTKLVQTGRTIAPTGDVVPPLHLAVAHEGRAQESPRFYYGRSENPTREQLERALADLEDARFALTFASGQAAAAALAELLEPGQCVVCSDDVYSGTRSVLDRLVRQGVAVHYADLTDDGEIEAALAVPGLAMVWLETPTNPALKVLDIARLSAGAAARGAICVVDNTFCTPALQQPLHLGAHVSLYSTTKYVAGHGDALGGALVLDDEARYARLRDLRTVTGAVPGPLDCFLVHRGLRTLSLRIERQVSSAEAVVELLGRHPAATVVRYPGLARHPQHAVAARQMRRPGAMITFEYAGPADELLGRLRVFAVAVSLGGVHSLAECPATMSHHGVPAGVRAGLGMTESTVRLSIGIEDPEDLVADLEEALDG